MADANVAIRAAVLARIPYLNAQPFYVDWNDAPGTSVDLVPRRLGDEARAGRVDAGLMASADFFALEDEFERVMPFAVARDGEVKSVLLLSETPLEDLAGGKILLTTESSTSAALVRLLLEKRFGIPGLVYERGDRTADVVSVPGEARLVIGDTALAVRKTSRERVLLDLGEAWSAWTGLPFVYAVWAVRRSLPPETRAAFAAFLEASLHKGENQLDAIGRAYSESTQGALGSPAELADYLRSFTYRAGPREEDGLAAFHRLWKESVA